MATKYDDKEEPFPFLDSSFQRKSEKKKIETNFQFVPSQPFRFMLCSLVCIAIFLKSSLRISGRIHVGAKLKDRKQNDTVNVGGCSTDQQDI